MSKTIQPEANMGATCCNGSDSYAATIVEASEKTIVVQMDLATLVSGSEQSCDAVYKFDRNPSRERVTYTLRKNGRWHIKGQPMGVGSFILVGTRQHLIDPDR